MRDLRGTRIRQSLSDVQYRIPASNTAALSDDEASHHDDVLVQPLAVLIVDDAPGDALLVRKMLCASGSNVLTIVGAASLGDAVTACTRERFDAVLLDLNLPDARGPAVVKEVRSVAPTAAVVVVSGDEREATALEAVRMGAQDYLLKNQLNAAALHRRVLCAIEHVHREAELEHQAHFDDLTGLAKRPLFFDRVEHALRRAEREGAALAVLYLDLNHFKAINDGFGHAAGDRVLQEFARRIEGALRQCDSVAVVRHAERPLVGSTAARLGGDEFSILLENVSDRAAVVGVVDRLKRTLGESMRVDGQVFVPETSIGFALYPEDGSTREQLLASADAAMYEAKRLRAS